MILPTERVTLRLIKLDLRATCDFLCQAMLDNSAELLEFKDKKSWFVTAFTMPLIEMSIPESTQDVIAECVDMFSGLKSAKRKSIVYGDIVSINNTDWMLLDIESGNKLNANDFQVIPIESALSDLCAVNTRAQLTGV